MTFYIQHNIKLCTKYITVNIMVCWVVLNILDFLEREVKGGSLEYRVT